MVLSGVIVTGLDPGLFSWKYLGEEGRCVESSHDCIFMSVLGGASLFIPLEA